MIKNKREMHVGGNLAVFEDLGIYSTDPKKDKKINNKLIKFLKSLGCTQAKIRIRKNNDFRTDSFLKF
jgi:hypothetical protein